jgi:hypothetical protein
MRVSGPLALWEAPYRSWLAAHGFTPGTIGDVMFHLEGIRLDGQVVSPVVELKTAFGAVVGLGNRSRGPGSTP